MGRTISKVYLYQAAGIAMALLVAGIIGWDIFIGPADSPQVVAIKTFKTPLELIKAGDAKSPGLQVWASRWQPLAATRPIPDSAMAEKLRQLQAVIDQGSLPAIACFQLSKMMEEGNDLPAAQLWAAAGIKRAESQLADARHDDRSVLPLLEAIRLAEEPLWMDYRNGPLLERMTSLLARFDRAAEWDQRPEWARIGHGESLYLQARFPEALAEADAMTTDAAKPQSDFTDEQKVGIHWLQAIILFDSYHYAQALPHLENVADFPTFHHSRDAWPLLILTLAHLGHSDLASARYRQYVERYHPDSRELAKLAAQMERAELLPP